LKELLEPKICKTDQEPVTPYQKAQAEWDRREGDARKQAMNWRLSAMISGLACLALIFGLIYQSSKSMVVPYVVQINSDGIVQAIGPAHRENYQPQEPEIKYFLSQIVSKTRSLPLDAIIAKKNWTDVYAFLRESAAQKMNTYMTQNNMVGRIGTETSQVEVTVIVPLSPHSYQVRWKETRFDLEGNQKEVAKMTGLFTIEFASPRNEKELSVNPLGLFIKDFSWSKEI
jgi:type IV secretory pathway TrbF-like protein